MSITNGALFAAIFDHIFTSAGLEVVDLQIEEEGEEYHAHRFKIGGHSCIYRQAKVTPKKVGLFVTLWKREGESPIEPFHIDDPQEFFFVGVTDDQHRGFFVFPKQELVKRGIVSDSLKEGKRAFRVYPPKTKTTNPQAIRTQKWQIRYYISCSPYESAQKRLLATLQND